MSDALKEVGRLVRHFAGIAIVEAPYLPDGYMLTCDREGRVVGLYSPKHRCWNTLLQPGQFNRLLVATDLYAEVKQLTGVPA